MCENHISIAIDGPSGAGKSTLARMLARDLGFLYVDTGAIYRTVGLYACESGVERTDAAGVIALLDTAEIALRHDADGTQRVLLNGRDVTGDIRSPEISLYASDVSRIPQVRAFLLEKQRELARSHDVIMDGRDIGTVVLPQAQLKIFLTATPEDRSMRRYRELLERGENTTYEEVLRDVLWRDKNDSNRDVAPLKPAPDSVIADTTGNELETSFAQLRAIVRDKLGL